MYDILKHDYLMDIRLFVNIFITFIFIFTCGSLNSVIISDKMYTIIIGFIVTPITYLFIYINFKLMRYIDNKLINKEE